MTDDQSHFQSLYDHTKQMIDRAEKREAELAAMTDSGAKSDMLASNMKILERLKADAEKLERLGWPS